MICSPPCPLKLTTDQSPVDNVEGYYMGNSLSITLTGWAVTILILYMCSLRQLYPVMSHVVSFSWDLLHVLVYFFCVTFGWVRWVKSSLFFRFQALCHLKLMFKYIFNYFDFVL